MHYLPLNGPVQLNFSFKLNGLSSGMRINVIFGLHGKH